MNRIRDEAELVELEDLGCVFSKEILWEAIPFVPGRSVGIIEVFNVGITAIDGEKIPFPPNLHKALNNDLPDWVPLKSSLVSEFRPAFRGIVVALIRVFGRDKISRIYLAISPNGLTDWKIYREPVFSPDENDMRDWGYEDVRIFYLPGIGFVITIVHYKNSSELGRVFRTELWSTENFLSYQYISTMWPPFTKDVVLAEELIDGKYVALVRPNIGDTQYIWRLESSDLIHWGEETIFLMSGMFPLLMTKVGCSGNISRMKNGGFKVPFHAVNNIEYANSFLGTDERLKRVTHLPKTGLIGSEEGFHHVVGGYPQANFSCGQFIDEGTDSLLYYVGIADKETRGKRMCQSRLEEDYILKSPV